MGTNKDNKTGVGMLLNTSLTSLGGGLFIGMLYPPFAVISWAFVCYGGYGIASYISQLSPFDRVFKNLGLWQGVEYPVLKEKKKTDISTIYTFTLPAGLSIEDFEKNKLAIENHLAKEIEIKYTFKAIQIEVFNAAQKELYEYEFTKCKGKVEFPVGYDRRDKLITCNLADGDPHLLIAGTSGGGKSTALRSIITNIILDKPDIKLHLIDLKNGAEFQLFYRCKNVASFSTDIDEADDTLTGVLNEVDRRYKLFRKHNCTDIKEYNKNVGKLGYEMLIVDEFADLQDKKSSILMLEHIAQKSRACGIHIIISTQRPDAQILNGRIKANVTVVLGLKTVNDTNSRIIINENGLEDLKGKGQGIFKNNNKTRIQCPFLTPEMAKELLQPTYMDKPQIDVDRVLEGDLL